MVFSVDDIIDEPNLSNEVVTKCYRPPELFLGNSKYTTKIDIWSLGCVITELFIRKILFKMGNSNDIIESIIKTVNEVDLDDLDFVEDINAISYIESVSRKDNGEIKTLLLNTIANEEGLDFLFL